MVRISWSLPSHTSEEIAMGRGILTVWYAVVAIVFCWALSRWEWPHLQRPCVTLGVILAVLGFILEYRVTLTVREETGLLPACLGATAILCGVFGLGVGYAECAMGNFRFSPAVLGLAFCSLRSLRVLWPCPPQPDVPSTSYQSSTLIAPDPRVVVQVIYEPPPTELDPILWAAALAPQPELPHPAVQPSHLPALELEEVSV